MDEMRVQNGYVVLFQQAANLARVGEEPVSLDELDILLFAAHILRPGHIACALGKHIDHGVAILRQPALQRAQGRDEIALIRRAIVGEMKYGEVVFGIRQSILLTAWKDNAEIPQT